MKLKPYSIHDHENDIDVCAYAPTEKAAVELYAGRIGGKFDVTIQLDYTLDFSEYNEPVVFIS